MKIELIPAIDIIDGKCVRLSQGDYDRRKEYDERPLEVAKRLQDVGIRRLHVVDLDGAASSHIVNYKSLEQIATHTDLMIDFGGGLKTDDDLRIAFECGAAMVTGGSIAVKDAETFCRWLQIYGSERIILGADAKDKKVAVSGWKENSDLELLPFISSYVEQGISKVICTDISKDGMLQGPAVELYQEILEQHPSLHLIASGGVGSMDDIKRLEEAGVPAVIFGKALYEGRITMDELIFHNS
ncbi:MAG: 1-(5-phosphoribosyl)-5-[Bacteroidaceae bacterium]|nr:1-(5-phosphoribosyl)-5-[(5-phosphoribosylamino)methylideneamino]imidazole-4-carboxamide isomerase [Bacteroidaceae bacterium]